MPHAEEDTTMPTPTAEGLARTGYPKGGRPRKIDGETIRWFVYVGRDARARAQERATRELPDGLDLPDVLRAALDDYAAGRYTPTLTQETA
jgi:hypothetical protein